MTTFVLCAAWFAAGLFIGGVFGFRLACYCCAMSLRDGSMKRIIDDLERRANA